MDVVVQTFETDALVAYGSETVKGFSTAENIVL